MSADVLAGYVWVAAFGAYLCIGPLVFRPTLQFGVRVPSGHAGAPVIRRERRAYRWRTALIAIVATAVLTCLTSHAARWPGRAIFVIEIAADLGCFWWAHRQIARVKTAEEWGTGRREVVVADTSWRTRPAVFPIWWLAPAIAVIAATIVVGVAHHSHRSNFGAVTGQAYVTTLWSGLLLLAYRSRPDLDVADPTGSLRHYRKSLATVGRAGLILLTGIDAALFLRALQVWRLLPMSGATSALIVAPPAASLLGLLAAAVCAGRARSGAISLLRNTARDDDRFWKGGIAYVNREDPAILISARTSFGWTFNLGNPTTWLLLSGWAALLIGFVAIRFSIGL